MSLVTKVNDLATRVAGEFNSVRGEIADLPDVTSVVGVTLGETELVLDAGVL